MSVIAAMTRSELEIKFKDMLLLIIEARDALPAISMTSAKMHSIDLTLVKRIEDCLEPFVTTDDDPNGI